MISTARDVTVATHADAPAPSVADKTDRREVTDRSAFAEVDAWLVEVAKRNAAARAQEGK